MILTYAGILLAALSVLGIIIFSVQNRTPWIVVGLIVATALTAIITVLAIFRA